MRIDDFESVFRSALKPSFERERVHLERVLHVSDGPAAQAKAEAEAVRAFLSALDDGDHGAMVTLASGDWSSAQDLLDAVDRISPQLIVCQRHLGDPDTDLTYTLGSVVDILTQACPVPVLLLPTPQHPLAPPERTMLVTDHLSEDPHLVSWGAHMTPDSGVLFLVHVEDKDRFEHMARAIRRISGLDTESTLKRLQDKLLEIPADYVRAVQRTLQAEGVQEEVVPVVVMGDPIALYPSLVTGHRATLLICSTQDPGQDAMAALAHALAVQLRQIPLLLV